MHIDTEWKYAPVKNPPMSVVLRDHVGKGGTAESYKTLQIKAHEALRAGTFEECLDICQRCTTKVMKTLGQQSPEHIYIKLIECEAHTSLMNYKEALAAVTEAGRLLDGCPGITDAHIFRVYYYRDLGQLHRLQHRLDEALECFQRVAETRRRFQGEDHPDTAIALMDVAIVHKMKRDYDRALQIFQFALVILDDTYGSESLHVGSNLLHQGSVYLLMGRFVEARDAIRNGRNIYAICGHQDHQDIATAEVNLGIIFGEMGKLDDSLKHFEKARELRELRFGLAHPDTAQVYIHIGRQLLKQGMDTEAENYATTALHILDAAASAAQHHTSTFVLVESSNPTSHASSPTPSHAPSNLSHKTGGLSMKSTKVQEKKQDSEQKKVPSETNLKIFEALADCHILLGEIYVSRKKFDDSRREFEEAKEIMQELPGREDDIKDIDAQIATAYLTEGASGDALDIFKGLLNDLTGEKKDQKKKGKKKAEEEESEEEDDADWPIDEEASVNVAQIMNGMGNAYRQQGKNKMAIKSFKRSLNNYERTVGIFDTTTSDVHMNMGHAYYSAGRFDDAMKEYNLARAIRVRIMGDVSPLTAESIRCIASVYVALHRYDEALGFYTAAADTIDALRGDKDPEAVDIRRTIAQVLRDKADAKAKAQRF